MHYSNSCYTLGTLLRYVVDPFATKSHKVYAYHIRTFVPVGICTIQYFFDVIGLCSQVDWHGCVGRQVLCVPHRYDQSIVVA